MKEKCRGVSGGMRNPVSGFAYSVVYTFSFQPSPSWMRISTRLAGPLASAIKQLPEDEQRATRAAIEEGFAPFEQDGEQYILGIFLTGAYQEILGDLHNLFGDTNAVHIRLSESGYEVAELVHGDTVTEVLAYVQYRASDLLATFRRKVAAATGITRQEANTFIADYVAGLEGYTYLEGEAAR